MYGRRVALGAVFDTATQADHRERLKMLSGEIREAIDDYEFAVLSTGGPPDNVDRIFETSLDMARGISVAVSSDRLRSLIAAIHTLKQSGIEYKSEIKEYNKEAHRNLRLSYAGRIIRKDMKPYTKEQIQFIDSSTEEFEGNFVKWIPFFVSRGIILPQLRNAWIGSFKRVKIDMLALIGQQNSQEGKQASEDIVGLARNLELVYLLRSGRDSIVPTLIGAGVAIYVVANVIRGYRWTFDDDTDD